MRLVLQYTTFRRDLAWLDYSLMSFRKFCTGFSGVKIVVPTTDIDAFLPLEQKYSTPDCPVLVRTFMEYPGKGFCHHMAMICYADVFSPDATHIAHIDPDCLFTRPTSPSDYIIDDRPILLIEPFDAIRQHGHMGRYGWKAVTENALKIPVQYETMCRHPAVHCKWLYKAVREHMEARHSIPFYDYVLRGKNDFPHEYAEFPTLGAFAVEMYPHKYVFINRGFDQEKNDPIPHLEQFWAGHTQPDSEHNQAGIKRILG